MHDDTRRLKGELDLTVVFVTHDQDEALSISDRLVVLSDGQMQQLGPPQEIYHRPSNEFVATFMGDANLVRILSSAYHGRFVRYVVDVGNLTLQAEDHRSDEPASVGETVGLAFPRTPHVLPA